MISRQSGIDTDEDGLYDSVETDISAYSETITEMLGTPVLNLNPENMSAHKTLSGILNYSKDNEHLNTMEKLSEKKDLKDPQKIDLYFALGKAYEDLKDYDKSFKYLNEANKVQKKKIDYHFKNDKDQFNQIQSVFNKLEFPIINHREGNKKIIFIFIIYRFY